MKLKSVDATEICGCWLTINVTGTVLETTLPPAGVSTRLPLYVPGPSPPGVSWTGKARGLGPVNGQAVVVSKLRPPGGAESHGPPAFVVTWTM